MDNMKFVHNGFDFDELYDLEKDPYEMKNLIDEPEYAGKLKELNIYMWQRIKETGNHTLFNTHYPILRLAPYGPEIIENK